VFDCVDLLILPKRLQVAVGIGDTALDRIRSFISGRTQQVVYGGEQSVTSPVQFGVPQGAVHGPLLYILHTAPLSDIIASHRVNAHQYADDLRLYLGVPLTEASITTDRLDACLVDVEAWLKTSRLTLNPSKTQLTWLGTAHTAPAYLPYLSYLSDECHLTSSVGVRSLRSSADSRT